jgi:heme exporter protein D
MIGKVHACIYAASLSPLIACVVTSRYRRRAVETYVRRKEKKRSDELCEQAKPNGGSRASFITLITKRANNNNNNNKESCMDNSGRGRAYGF